MPINKYYSLIIKGMDSFICIKTTYDGMWNG